MFTISAAFMHVFAPSSTAKSFRNLEKYGLFWQVHFGSTQSRLGTMLAIVRAGTAFERKQVSPHRTLETGWPKFIAGGCGRLAEILRED